jgi:hypothetical protein
MRIYFDLEVIQQLKEMNRKIKILTYKVDNNRDLLEIVQARMPSSTKHPELQAD